MIDYLGIVASLSLLLLMLSNQPFFCCDTRIPEIVADQLTDFKRRLGIDYYVTGLTFDKEAIQLWLKDIGMKTKKGLVFYVKGTRLFVDDIVFCLSLIGRALQGYTLKPREVRTLR